MSYTKKNDSSFFRVFLIILLIPFFCKGIDNDAYLVKKLCEAFSVPEPIESSLYQQVKSDQSFSYYPKQSSEYRPLFASYPAIRKGISHVALADLPTPIQKLEKLGDYLNLDQFYIKQDDLTGKEYENGKRYFGGNKVRKLEFLLADALSRNANTVMTFGGVGSNHVTATAVHAHALGLNTIAILEPQHNSDVLRRNVLLMDYYDTEFHLCPNVDFCNMAAVYTFLHKHQQTGFFPYVIPMGGSNVLGVLGFVNAVFELKEQIDNGVMPEPDYIYGPAGSVGTISGILLGVKILGLKSKVISIAVSPEAVPGARVKKIHRLMCEANELLHSLDSSFPLVECSQDEIILLNDYCGPGYAIDTQEGNDAIEIMREKEGIVLDPVYTGKVFSGVIDDVRKHQRKGIVLFWNTYYSGDCADMVNTVDFKNLPVCFHDYFVN